MRIPDLILKKRNGGILEPEEIHWLISGYAKGDIPDYQIAALMMAIYFRGLNQEETLALVRAMLESGDQIDLSSIPGPKVDKHSTGGVGDKTSLVLAPMVAAAGLPVPKMSGRGLGHTGGTLDKLEAFTGFQVRLDEATFFENVREHGIAIAGQTANLVPADKQLYALRDVTGTVENPSLIAASIMSKKLASGADNIVLDIKTGSGAFIKSLDGARELARTMVNIGKSMGRKVQAILTSMNQPLGNTIGNALEIKESIATLKGEGPEDLTILSYELAARMLILGGKAGNLKEAQQTLKALVESGAALEKLRTLVRIQGGDPAQVDQPETLPSAPVQIVLEAKQAGYVHEVDALTVGKASMILGAGRVVKNAPIDLSAGIELKAKRGSQVSIGSPLAIMHTASEMKIQEALPILAQAFEIRDRMPDKRPLILEVITD